MGINSNAYIWLAFTSFEIRQALKNGYATSYTEIFFLVCHGKTLQ